MAAGGVPAATLQILLTLVCLLCAASGLQQIPNYDLPDMYRSFTRNRIWYPPAVEVIVIDLGNTNSCVAGYGGGGQTQAMFQLCIPSWVAFADDGAVLVGEDARNHAAVNPQAAVSGFKRLLGQR